MKPDRQKPIFDSSDYRALLRTEMTARQSHNPAYSQRAFARDLNLAPGRLNEILKGRQHLSAARASDVARRLDLSAEEICYFVDLVRSKHARSRLERTSALQRLDAWRKDRNYRELQLSAFQLLSDWLPFAILELVKVKKFQPKVRWISNRLNVSEVRVTRAIENLERLELLKRDGEVWTVLAGNTSLMGGVPSRAVKNFHRQILQKGTDALFRQELNNREFNALVLAFDRRRLPELKARMREFTKKIDAEFGMSTSQTDVACISSQLFLLTEGSEP